QRRVCKASPARHLWRLPHALLISRVIRSHVMSLVRRSGPRCARKLQARTTLPHNNRLIESSAAYLLLLRLNRHQAMTRFPLEIGKFAVGSCEELMIVVG